MRTEQSAAPTEMDEDVEMSRPCATPCATRGGPVNFSPTAVRPLQREEGGTQQTADDRQQEPDQQPASAPAATPEQLNSVAELQARVEQLTKEKADLVKEKADWVKEKADLREQLQQSEANFVAAVNSNEELQKQMQALQVEVKAAKASAEQCSNKEQPEPQQQQQQQQPATETPQADDKEVARRVSKTRNVIISAPADMKLDAIKQAISQELSPEEQQGVRYNILGKQTSTASAAPDGNTAATSTVNATQAPAAGKYAKYQVRTDSQAVASKLMRAQGNLRSKAKLKLDRDLTKQQLSNRREQGREFTRLRAEGAQPFWNYDRLMVRTTQGTKPAEQWSTDIALPPTSRGDSGASRRASSNKASHSRPQQQRSRADEYLQPSTNTDPGPSGAAGAAAAAAAGAAAAAPAGDAAADAPDAAMEDANTASN
jgi:hypothetical protein